MARSYWMDHKGKKILFIDFSNTDHVGVRQTVAEAKAIIVNQPKNSVLCLVETFNTKFSIEISKEMKDFTLHNKPFMRMTALVGVEGLQKVILNSVLIVTKRTNLVVKKSREDALAFLATQ